MTPYQEAVYWDLLEKVNSGREIDSKDQRQFQLLDSIARNEWEKEQSPQLNLPESCHLNVNNW